MLAQLWLLSMFSFILEWRHSSISFSQKTGFLNFTKKTIVFHALVLTLNYKSVFSRSDDVTNPHLPLFDVTLLPILIENVVLVVSQEKITFTNVCITLFWAQSKKTRFWGSDDVIMMSQAPRLKLRLGAGSFVLWHIRNNNQQSKLSQKKTPKDLK